MPATCPSMYESRFRTSGLRSSCIFTLLSRLSQPGRVTIRYRPNRRKRKELLTTVTDDSAIAAAAKMGAFSRKSGMSGERIAVGIKMTLYAKAQKRFCLMVRKVARERASAVATLFKLPLTNVIRFIPVDVTFSIPSTRMMRLFPRSQIEEPHPELLPRYIDKMPLHRSPGRLPRTALDYVRRDAIRR